MGQICGIFALARGGRERQWCWRGECVGSCMVADAEADVRASVAALADFICRCICEQTWVDDSVAGV